MIKITAKNTDSDIAPESHISGQAWRNKWIYDNAAGCAIAIVSFAPGARTHWHKHPTSQVLIAEQGRGYVQKRGEAAKVFIPGDVVVILPNEEHWHGASAGSIFVHTAIQLMKDEATVIKKVTDEEYAQANQILTVE